MPDISGPLSHAKPHDLQQELWRAFIDPPDLFMYIYIPHMFTQGKYNIS